MTEVVRNRGHRKGNFRPGPDPKAVCLIGAVPYGPR